MRTNDERESWNRRYRQGSHSSQRPDPLLPYAYEEFIQPIFPDGGTALDVAGGVGRHAIWLARRDWRATLTDISDAGIALARKNAGPNAERINFQLADLTTFRAAKKRYDLVLVFFYLERSIFPELLRVVRPGGLLVYKTYTRLQHTFGGGPSHPLHLLKENELLHAFPKLQLLHYQETIRGRGVAEFVGRKKRR